MDEEQVLIKKKKKADFENEILEEALSLGENPTESYGSKYDDPDVITYIVDGRTKGKTFSDITEGLRERGFPNIQQNKVSELYYKAVAKVNHYHNSAADKFTDFSEQLNIMNEKRMRIINDLLDVVQRLNKELNEAEDLNLLEKTMKHIRLYPQIISILSEFNRVFDSYIAYQDRVEKAQEASVWNESDMIGYIDKYLKTLEKNGQIKILDNTLK